MIIKNVNGEKKIIATSITNHDQLKGLDVADSHPMSAITGLSALLQQIQDKADAQHTSIENILLALDDKISKVVTPETYTRVYAILEDGTNDVLNVTSEIVANAIVRREADGNISVPDPTSAAHATHKKYVDDLGNSKVSKVTSQSSNYRVYSITPDGLQETLNVSSDQAMLNSLVQRSTGGAIVAGTPVADNHSATKLYVDTKYAELNSQIGNVTESVQETLDTNVSDLYNLLKADGLITEEE